MNKFTFALCRLHYLHDEEHWYCKIDTTDKLMSFLKVRAESMMDTYFSAKGKQDHFKRDEAMIVCALEKHPNRDNVFDDARVLEKELLNVYTKAFMEHGCILVGEKFGFMPMSEQITIVREVDTDTFAVPNKRYTNDDIEVSQWIRGKHYYAKVGLQDVVVEGQQKWHTFQTAHDMAKIFVKQLNKAGK